MNIHFPDARVLCVADNAARSMHNILTPRGALVRDPRIWAHYLDEAIELFGADSDVLFSGHHWPCWGGERIVDYLEKQRDLYTYLHDQTLRLLNQGLHRAGDRRADRAAAEPRRRSGTAASTTARSATTRRRSTSATWAGSTATRPTSGSTRRSSRRAATSSSWAAPRRCWRRPAQSFEAGDYRWVAEVVNHVVFAEPENEAARELQADALEQLGYGAENATWRNFFLMGAKELREGISGTPTATAPPDVVARLTVSQLLDAMAIRLDGPRAWEQHLRIDWVVTDPDEQHALTVRNGVLRHRPGRHEPRRRRRPRRRPRGARPAAAQNRRHRRAGRERPPAGRGRRREARRAARPARRARPRLRHRHAGLECPKCASHARPAPAALATVLLALSVASLASAADSVYWVNYGANKISRANLYEGGGADLPIAAANVNGPYGLAIDSAGGRIYWLNTAAGGSIGYANLDGSGSALLNTAGASFANPAGLAIDPAGGRIYWAKSEQRHDRLRQPQRRRRRTAQSQPARPRNRTDSRSIPPAAAIYWTNFTANKISYANLNGSGGGDLDTTGAPIDGPEGVAIDPASSRIYWTNWNGNSIGYASLAGGGGGQFDTGVVLFDPVGLAIHPYDSSLYWADEGNEAIGYRSLNGASGGQVIATGATLKDVAFPVLLVRPHMQSFPLAYGGHRPGVVLACRTGEWKGDLLGSFFYQAPQSFSYQWLRNGKPITGATQSGIVAEKVGKYNCEVTAANGAGSDTEPSNKVTITASLKLEKVKLDPSKGTATLRVKVTGSGPLTLSGKGIVRQRRPKQKERGYLTVRAKGKARQTLKATGRVKVKAKIAYVPAGGKALRKTKTIVLKKGLR